MERSARGASKINITNLVLDVAGLGYTNKVKIIKLLLDKLID